jgi:acyl-coenzyme A synthetase/AMP-(fatty) acid ligase
VCLVQFSSGSTGRSKVIGRTARSILDEIDRYAALAGMPTVGEKVVLLNSVTHTMGLVGGILHGLNAGTTLVLPARIQPTDILRAAADTGAQSIFGVPVHFDLLSRVGTAPSLPALRLAVSAGEVLTPEIAARFRDRFGVPISQVYGMTEVGMIAADLAARHPLPAVGTAVPGISLRAVDGELSVRLDRSPYLTDEGGRGYADGWLRTFDRCTLDPETGVLAVTGRADATVVIGGLKVDLAEVEAVLLEHDQVTEAVVVFGSVIEAYLGVCGELTAAEVIAWCRERLSDHKVPKLVYLDQAVPRNPMGKLLRSRELLHAAHLSKQNAPATKEKVTR